MGQRWFVAAVVVAACVVAPATAGDATDTPNALAPISSAIWMGDSLAFEEAPGVEAALESAGLAFSTYAYAPPVAHEALMALGEDWESLTAVAHQVAERYPGRVFVVDSFAAWGDEFVGQAPDGTAIRKPDGVHICPLDATMFADFLVHWLADHFAGLRPTDVSAWPIDWWNADRYDRPAGSCDALPPADGRAPAGITRRDRGPATRSAGSPATSATSAVR